jgi:DNA-binding MarR family transcriptional regulator
MMDLEARAIELKKNVDLISAHFAPVSSDELSIQEMKIVDFIGQRESCIMREISEYTQVAVSTMTGIVDKLEDKGFVRRERNDEDRRIVRVFLTVKGRKLYKSYVENYLELSRQMLRELSEDEQKTYLELMKKIARGAAHFTAPDSGG